jgi:hypothetical protein
MTTLAISTPVTGDNVTYSELTFRRPRFGDTEAALNALSMVTAMAILDARLSNVPIDVIRDLDVEDSALVFEACRSNLRK